jgi:Uma2 family endonuclease
MRRLFTVDEYHRMVDAGILREDDRVELLDGEIVEMTPIGPHHAGCVNRLNRLLIEALGRRGVVTPQNPFLLDERSEPQPDLCVAKPRPDDYASGHPRPADLLLVIEVSDSSLTYDRNRKARAIRRPASPRCG